MRNPFKKKGLPDCGFHDGNPQQQTNTSTTSTLIPVSSSSSTASHSNMGSEPIVHPYAARSSNSNSPHTIDPPIAHPYAAHPYAARPYAAHPYAAHPYAARPDPGQSPGPVCEFHTGENRNMKGEQSSGNIRVIPPTSLPQDGRFVCNTGKNYNEGDSQNSGDVDFSNDGSGAR